MVTIKTETLAFDLATDLAMELFNMELDIPVVLNGRLTRALGHVKFRRVNGEMVPYQMDLAKRLFENYDEETIVGVIKHELCHWALCKMGQPFDDGHPVFEAELKRIGAPSTEVIAYKGTLHICVCAKCNQKLIARTSKGRLNKYLTAGYRSKCCRAPIQYGGEEVIN